MTTPDDDAFRWDGDDDPTLSVTPDAVASSGSVTAPDPQPVPAADEPVDAEPAGIGNVALVAYGVLGGVYALWTAGWVIGALRLKDRIEGLSGSVADFMFQGSMVLAIAAPAIWFVVSLLGTRGRPAWHRFLWLALGVLVLIPWPFVMVGVIGQ
jgi:hypothetical protein